MANTSATLDDLLKRIEELERKISTDGPITDLRWSDTTRTKYYESNDQLLNELLEGGVLTAAGYGEGPNYTQQFLRKLEVKRNGVWTPLTYTPKIERK